MDPDSFGNRGSMYVPPHRPLADDAGSTANALPAVASNAKSPEDVVYR
jgi:hypothetical protein